MGRMRLQLELVVRSNVRVRVQWRLRITVRCSDVNGDSEGLSSETIAQVRVRVSQRLQGGYSYG